MTETPDGCPDCGHTQFEVATMGQRRCARCGFYSPVPAHPRVRYDGPVFALPVSNKETNKTDALKPVGLLLGALLLVGTATFAVYESRQTDQNRQDQRSNSPKDWKDRPMGPFKPAK